MSNDNKVPTPIIGRSYEADDYGWLGKYFEMGGVTYQFCKFASGLTPAVQQFDAVTVSPAAAATFPASNKINGIAAASFNAGSADVYALVAVWEPTGANNAWVNVSHGLTASADWTGQHLAYSADAAGFGNKGRPVTGAAYAASVAATGGLSSYSSANTQAIEDAIYTNINAITAAIQSKMVAAGAVSAVTGAALSDVYFKFGTAGVVVSGITAPVKDYLRIGNVISTGGETQVITAVSTATNGLTAELGTAFTTAAIGTGTASACAKVYIGNVRVKSILE